MRKSKLIDASMRDFWAGHIEAWMESRIARLDYCRAHGLRAGTMLAWVRRLAPHALSAKEKRPGFGRHHPSARAARSKAVQAFWAMHVEAMVWSGFSAGAYAKAHHLCASTLREWRLRFEDQPLESDWRELLHPAARPRVRRSASSAAKPQAADLRLTEAAPAPAPKPAIARRAFTELEKRAIVAESEGPGVSVATICRKHDIATSMVFRWRVQFGLKRPSRARLAAVTAADAPLLLDGLIPAPPGMAAVEIGDGRRVFAPLGADAAAVRAHIERTERGQ